MRASINGGVASHLVLLAAALIKWYTHTYLYLNSSYALSKYISLRVCASVHRILWNILYSKARTQLILEYNN